MRPGTFRLRKTTDIGQEHPVYEIVDEERRTLLDVTKTDTGLYEACILDNEGEARVIELAVLFELLEKARREIEKDE